jgi:hypothetical protein
LQADQEAAVSRAIAIPAAALLLFAPAAALPSSALGPGAPAPLTTLAPDTAHAQATKSRGTGNAQGSGGANVRGAGERLGDLLASWGVPIVTVIAGFLLIAALLSRNIGATVGIVASAIVVLIFLLTPESIESAAKGISNLIF